MSLTVASSTAAFLVFWGCFHTLLLSIPSNAISLSVPSHLSLDQNTVEQAAAARSLAHGHLWQSWRPSMSGALARIDLLLGSMNVSKLSETALISPVFFRMKRV